jgi:NADPH:quinone reductase-like Zn-dependent oxidoreductase
MKAAVLHQPGTIPVYQDFPDPVPAEGEQLLLVKASSIKNIDLMRARGTHYDQYPKYPVVTGLDGVGWLNDGKRVYAGSQKGMMAEKAAVPTRWVVPVPDELDDVTASALPNPAVSAWLSLESEKKLTANDALLILGATGTTGRLAVQLARQLGAGRIIAMGRNKTILETLV